MPCAPATFTKTIGIGLAAVAAAIATPAAASDAARALPELVSAPAAFIPVDVPEQFFGFEIDAGIADAGQTCAAAPLYAKSAKPASALERMRMAQAQTEATSPHGALQPAAQFGIACREPAIATFSARRSAPGAQDFLQSRILPVSKTGFDSEWNRVSTQRSGRATTVAAQIAATGGSLEARIAAANRWVNAKVSYVEDAVLYARTDYWASAEQTLRAGKGDCEDFAIAKLHVLAAMGVKHEDMYLTIARDLVARGDHAVLVVKIDGKALVLDNATDTIVDAYGATDLRPVLSFSAGNRYIHGYS